MFVTVIDKNCQIKGTILNANLGVQIAKQGCLKSAPSMGQQLG